MAESDISFAIVNNIPKVYHSSDLRNFFSTLIETSAFSCFHFRHRPEVQQPQSSKESSNTEVSSRCITTCCVVKVRSNRIDEFIEMYNRKHWVDKKGHSMVTRCFIKRVSIRDVEITNSFIGPIQSTAERDVVTKSDLTKLIELHPPVFMPQGNVGTPTQYFLDEIKLCRLPPSIISKLGLVFPLSRSKRLYGCVNYNYGGRKYARRGLSAEESLIRTLKGDVISENYVEEKDDQEEDKKDNEDNDEDEEFSGEEEEWDRHESLHNDVTQQERSKERLFEEKIELKWEKGGSGLVFYTDAQFWDEKDGDFDAKTADDWDVDMSVYYEPGAGDMDARDQLKMRLEQRLRQGTMDERTDVRDFAGFEKHTTGFGRRVLESQGWKQGEGIGKTIIGMAEPILDSGKHPFDKKGFGYRGEKLNRYPVRSHPRRRRKRHYSVENDDMIRISTIYDNPSNNDPPEPLLRSNFPTYLSYRKEFLKEQSSDSAT